MASFRGGERIIQKLKELTERLTSAKTVRIGFLSGAKYPSGLPVAFVASVQEWGAPKVGIPPRPFFRTMIAKHKDEWPEAVADLLKENDYDAQRTLELTGEAIAGQLRQSIIDTNSPPLSPTTLMLRKMFGNHPEKIRGRDVVEARHRVAAGESYAGVSTKPLVLTGHLLSSVDFEVVE
jgi:hypothetical protein